MKNQKFIKDLQNLEGYQGNPIPSEITRLQYITPAEVEAFTGQKLDDDANKYIKQFISTACFYVNDLASGQIENLPNGFTDLQETQKYWVKQASLFLVTHYLSGSFGWGVGAEATNQGQQAYSFSTTPDNVTFIPPQVYKALQQAGLYFFRTGINYDLTNQGSSCSSGMDKYNIPWGPGQNAISEYEGRLIFVQGDNIGSSDGSITVVKTMEKQGNYTNPKIDLTVGFTPLSNGLDAQLQSSRTGTGTPFIQNRSATDSHIFFLNNGDTEISGTNSLSLITNRDTFLQLIATSGPEKGYVKILKNLDMSKFNINNVVSLAQGDSTQTSAGLTLTDAGVNVQAVGPTEQSKGVFSVNAGVASAPVPIIVGSDSKVTVYVPLDMDQQPIKNVLAGIADTDAVNVGQIFQKIVDTIEAGTNITTEVRQGEKKLVINSKGGGASGTWQSDLTKSYDEATSKLTHILKGTLDDYTNGYVDIAITKNATNNELDFTVAGPYTPNIPKISFKVANNNIVTAQLTITPISILVGETIDMQSNKITNLRDGTDAHDAMAIGQVYPQIKDRFIADTGIKIVKNDQAGTLTFSSTAKSDTFNIILPTKKYLKISKNVLELTLNIPLFKNDQIPIDNQIIQTFAVGAASVRNTITSVNNVDPTALAFEIYSFDTPDQKIEYYIWNRSDFDNAIYINTATAINSSEIFIVDNVPSGAIQEPIEWVKFYAGLADPIISVLSGTTAIIGIKDTVDPTIWKYAIRYETSGTPGTGFTSGGNYTFQVLGSNTAQFNINSDNLQSNVKLLMGDENVQYPITYVQSTPNDRLSVATVGWVLDNFGSGDVSSVLPDTTYNSIFVTPETGKGEVKIGVVNPLPNPDVLQILEVTERPEVVFNAFWPTGTGKTPTWSLRANFQNGSWYLIHDNLGDKASFGYNNDGTSPESGKLNCYEHPLINVGDAVNQTDAVNLKVLGTEIAKLKTLASNLKSINSTSYGGLVGAVDDATKEQAQTGYNDNKLGDLLHQFTSSWTVKLGNGSTAKPITQIMQLRYISATEWIWEMATPIKMYDNRFHIELARNATKPLEAVPLQQLAGTVDILTATKTLLPDTTLSSTSKLVYILTGDAEKYLSVEPILSDPNAQWVFKIRNTDATIPYNAKWNTFTAKEYRADVTTAPNGPATTTMWGIIKPYKRTFSYFSLITRQTITSICLNIETETGNFDTIDQGQKLEIFAVNKLPF